MKQQLSISNILNTFVYLANCTSNKYLLGMWLSSTPCVAAWFAGDEPNHMSDYDARPASNMTSQITYNEDFSKR